MNLSMKIGMNTYVILAGCIHSINAETIASSSTNSFLLAGHGVGNMIGSG